MAFQLKSNKKESENKTIRFPLPLVEQIDKMAESDNRNRSNFIANTLQNLAREFANVAEPKKTIK